MKKMLKQRQLSATSSDNESDYQEQDEQYEESSDHNESEFMGYAPNTSFSGSNSNRNETMIGSHKRKLSGGSSSGEDSTKQNMKLDLQGYSSKSFRMMQNMGYKADTGLGKLGQGRIEPVEASTQKGRRGLGLKLDGLDLAATEWDASMEKLSIPEEFEWLESTEDDLSELTRDVLHSWRVVGEKKMTLDDETKFCEPRILAKVLESKSVFDNLGANDMRRARTKSNPFETIKGNIFINRAAVKMANMDSLFDFMFTNPVDELGIPLVKDDELLYFADVCAGPGGFTEYILWRKKWIAKGFGFTLKGDNDFKLHDFYAGNPETFDPYYGIKDDGNVFDPANIESFTEYVNKQTVYGVHFMMADGGFSVESQENVQEILSKQLYLCQILVALSVVRTNGHFVVKLFDLFTPFSVGLVYLMYKCFKKINICKPNTSRPANSERYLVCKWKKSNTDVIQRHLFEINEDMWKNKNPTEDILEIVPYSILKGDENFFEYIYDSNNIIGGNQIVGLLKIAAFCKDPNLNEIRQTEIKNQCLELWKLENSMRKAPTRKTNDAYFVEMLKEWKTERTFLSGDDRSLNGEKLDKWFGSILGWYFVALDVVEDTGKNIRTFFMSKGGREVLQYNKSSKSWTPIKDIFIELSPETLIYGEIAKELLGEGRSQVIINALHIIDGMILGGIDIRRLPLKQRNKMCQKFAKALNKPFKTILNKNDDQSSEQSTPIRCKKLFDFENLESFFDDLDYYKLKDGKERLGYNLRNDIEPDRFYIPRGLLFLNETRDDYIKMYSKTAKRHYFYEKAKNISLFSDKIRDPSTTVASFKNTFTHRLLWNWQDVNQVASKDELPKGYIKCQEYLYRIDLNELIMSKRN